MERIISEDLALALIEIGKSYQMNQKPLEAMFKFQSALEIRRKLYEDENFLILKSLTLIQDALKEHTNSLVASQG